MKIVLAYSGGLDTSVLLSWIKETYGNAEMVAFCANIGQEDELKGLEKKAKKTGASKIYIDDLQEEFAADFIFPMIGEELGLRFTLLTVFCFLLIMLSGVLIAVPRRFFSPARRSMLRAKSRGDTRQNQPAAAPARVRPPTTAVAAGQVT